MFDFLISIGSFIDYIITGAVNFFKKVISVIQTTIIPALKKAFGALLQGIKTFIEKICESYKEVENGYAYDREVDKWKVRTYEREISPEEVPADIREKIESEKKVDTTDRVEKELAC